MIPLRTSAFFFLMMGGLVVAMGYGVALPALPLFLEGLLADPARSVPWHTGLLTGVYLLALFLFAPLWGRWSDRYGRRPVILIGLAGSALALVIFSLAQGLAVAYVARVLGGAFAAAVLPVTLAYVGDASAPGMRALRFAWITAASALGFLLGPVLGGWLSGTDAAAQVGVATPLGSVLSIPLFVVAVITAAVGVSSYVRLPEVAEPGGPRLNDRPRLPGTRSPFLAPLLVLGFLATFGLGAFEVSVTLLGRTILGLSPSGIGLLFTTCSLVMIAAQLLVFSPGSRRFDGTCLLAPAFVLMAVALVLQPFAAQIQTLLPLVGLLAVAMGVLAPTLVFLVSLSAGVAQGSALGTLTAVSSLGQALGSVSAGWLFAIVPQASFWFTAALLLIGAVIGLITGRKFQKFVGDGAYTVKRLQGDGAKQ
ncbi:MAG: MFS transporter [Pseudomonadota bacterium]